MEFESGKKFLLERFEKMSTLKTSAFHKLN